MADLFSPDEVHVEVLHERRTGMKVGLDPTGVRVTHLATKTVAEVWSARSQHHMRRIAFDMLATALTDKDFG